MRPQTTACSHAEGVSVASTTDDYLTDRKFGSRLDWSPKTVERKVREGVFIEGVHYFQRPGMRRRWKWSAIVRWLENGDDGPVPETAIPLAGMTRGRAVR